MVVMRCPFFVMSVVFLVLFMTFYCNAQAYHGWEENYRPGLVITSGCPATPIFTPVTTPNTLITTPTMPVTPITAAPIYEDGHAIEGVQNGGFDSPALILSETSSLSGSDLPLRGWKVEGGVKYVENGYKHVETLDGGNAVQVGDGGKISQYMALQNGLHYTITFSAAPVCNSVKEWRLNVSISNATRTLFVRPPNCQAWDVYSWAFRADSNQPKLEFLNPDHRTHHSDCAPLVDAISVQPLLLHTLPQSPGNLIENGDFEQGIDMSWSPSSTVRMLPNPDKDYKYSSLSGWHLNSETGVNYISTDQFPYELGRRAMELAANGSGSISQKVVTVPGHTYLLTYFSAIPSSSSSSCSLGSNLTLSVNGNKVSVSVSSDAESVNYRRNTLILNATSALTSLHFTTSSTAFTDAMSTTSPSPPCNSVIDGVSLVLYTPSPFPSPSSSSCGTWGHMFLGVTIFMAILAVVIC